MKKIYIILMLLSFSIANSQIQSDVSDKLWAIVIPVADAINVDMKQCVLGTVKDSVVSSFVKNTGQWKIQVDSIFFRGFDEDAFSLVSGIPKYEVAVGKNEFGEFRFKPTKVGIHNAEIVIITKLDTIIRKIQGEGVSPQLQVINDIIDFGKTDIGSSKDTVDVVTIKNIGNSPLFITKTFHNKPNDRDFSTISGGGAFELKVNETCKMHLRYTAYEVGKTTGLLEFHYNGPGSPASVVLFGEGVNKDPQIAVSQTKFPDIVCETYSTAFAEITNIGDKTLIINDLQKSFDTNDEFDIITSLPINVEPNKTEKIEIKFNPKSIGSKNFDLEIISNSKTDSNYKISFTANKDSVGFTPEFDKINLGFLCPNEIKNYSINIKNTGTIAAGGFFRANSKIKFVNNEFVLNIDKSYSYDFTYLADNSEGIFSDTITIVDSLCNFEKNVIVYGNIELPNLWFEPLEITSFIGQSKIGKLKIKNTSNRSLTINDITVFLKEFEIESKNLPIEVPAGKDTIVEIKYIAKDFNILTGEIEFEIEPCSQIAIAQVKGMPASAFAKLNLENISGYTNQIVEVPIFLNENNLKSAAINSFIGELFYNPTLLEPIDLKGEIINEQSAKVSITVGDIEFNPIAKVRFRTGLGNADNCELIFDNLKPFTGVADFEVKNSNFTLLGICLEGGKRLINPNSQSSKLKTTMSARENKMQINFNLIENGVSSLSIYDYSGKKISSNQFINSVGEQSLEVNISDYNSGVYFIILETPTIFESTSIIIEK